MNSFLNTINLGEGINFHFVSDDTAGKFKTAVICILIRSKLTRGNATINAIIPSVLQYGSEKYRTLAEINAATEMMYGAVFDIQVIKKGEEQIIQFYLEFVCGNEGGLEENKNQALDFLNEIMLRPLVEDGGFRVDAVEHGKQDLKNLIDGRLNNKSEYAKLRCIEEMCAGEPFGVSADGYAEDLDGLDGNLIYSHYLKLLRTSPIEFIFSGDICKDFCLQKIKSLFLHGLEMCGRSNRYEDFIIPRAEITFRSGDVKYKSESMNVSQGKVCMGYRAGADPVSDEFYSLSVFNELLGGSSNSRLFTEIREKKNLCYYINSFVFRFKSLVIIQSGTDSSEIGQMIEHTEKIIAEMREPDAIDDEEFENAKKSLIMKYKAITDNQNSMIEFYLSQYLLLDQTDLEAVTRRLSAVEKAAVCEIAGKIKPDTIFMLNGEEKNG